MFSLDECKSLCDSGGEWTSDLARVPKLSERVMEAHFVSSNRQQHKGQNRLPVQTLVDITFRKHVINKAVPAKRAGILHGVILRSVQRGVHLPHSLGNA
ncbi:hypothetical protein HPB52_008139 [Rhipicephalus sanguineus]|uniref:Uncharacterized protein n=2 Tax=Rhipicephalus sanguineus TaxID=34632 RepID=A0A9D4SY29_RHISA|nr:hypothetical protein HPB52_008139 [Rhipicephalus sanguineus]